MVSIKPKISFLIACLLDTIWLLYAQVTGNETLLLLCLVVFMAITCLSAIKGMAVPVFLYFLPFSTLLKLQPGENSYYTIALLAVYLIFILTNGRNILIKHFIPGASLLLLTLVVKTLYGYEITNSYIMFFSTMLLIPFVLRELNKNYDFYWLTLFFAIGIVFAAITSQYLSIFPTISRYIDLHDVAGIVRRSGYYGDPNFYAAQITAALSGVLILLLNNKKKGKMFVLVVITPLLIYCGFLSISKSFLLVLVCIVMLWSLELMVRKGKLSLKLMIVVVAVVGVLFLLSSTIFLDNVGMMLERFDRNNSLNDFTTGRTEIWGKYFNEFDEDPILLLFGKGLTRVLIDYDSSHNTVIQCIFQFGIVGCLFLFMWLLNYVKLLLGKTRFTSNSIAQICIILIGAFGPWMALDLLLFDEFFLIPIYACTGIRSLGYESTQNNV